MSGPARRRERKAPTRLENLTADGLVRFFALALAMEHPEWERPVRDALGRMPPEFHDVVLDVLSQLAVRMFDRGWTKERLCDLELNLLGAPSDGDVEHDLRLVALFSIVLASKRAKSSARNDRAV